MLSRFFTLCLISATACAAPSLRYEQMAPSYLATYPFHEQDARDSESDANATVPELSERELTRIGLNILAEDEKILAKTNAYEEITSAEVWHNLELFANEHQRPDKTIVGRIARTQTTLGRLVLAKMLTEPTTNISLLQQRQNLLKTLVDCPQLCRELSDVLKTFAEHESNLLALTRQNDPLRQDDIYNYWYKGNLFGGSASTLATEKLVDDTFTSVFDTIGIISALITGYQLYTNYEAKMAECENRQQKFLRTIAPVLAVIIPLGLHYLGKGRRKSFIYLKKRLRSAHYFAQTLCKIKHALQDDTFSLLDEHSKLLHQPKNQELVTLKKAINSPSLRSDRYWFAKSKPTFQAFPLIREHIHSFLQGASLIGSLDAFLSMAQLIREHKTAPVSYNFVEYAQHQTPFINAADFWHPSLSCTQAVTNSVTLGDDQNPRNLIITGPNAGGKSTTMKALAICLILGQTFGIAPAERFVFTPFSKINTYLNIADDIGADRSLFKAELYRARTLLEQSRQLAPGTFCFTLLDEIFTGTEPIEGQAGAYGVARSLAESSQNMTLLATHFSALTELATDTNNAFKNMKVTVSINEDGSLSYPYTLVPGISNQHIALAIIAHEGIGSLITDTAQHVLSHPAQYMPTDADI